MHFHQLFLWIIFFPCVSLINNDCRKIYYSYEGCTFKYFYATSSSYCYNCTFYNFTQFDQISLENSDSLVTIVSGFIPTLTSKLVSDASKVYILQINDVELDQIESDALKYYTNLKQLDLSNNKLTNVQNYIFDYLSNLKVLLLSNNSITTLSINSFTGLNNLKQLDLSHNKLKFISIIIFHNTPVLEVLDISYNFVESIDASELKHLTLLNEINIDGNIKLSCTALFKVLKLYKSLGILVAVGEAKNQSSISGIPCFDSNFTFVSVTENISIEDSKNTKENIIDIFEQKASLNKLINGTTINHETIITYIKTVTVILTILLICIGIVTILVSYKFFIRNQFWFKSFRARRTTSNINEDSAL